MNVLALFIALTILQSWTLTWAASYLIALNNGNEIETDHYWDEGDEIKFYLHGGVVGIPKANVIDIKSFNTKLGKKKEMLPIEGGMKDQIVRDNTTSPMNNREGTTSQQTDKIAASDYDYYRSQKATLKDKLNDALERNREATQRKDQGAKDATRQEMHEYLKKIYDLEAELKEKNNGILPKWWNE